MDPKYEWIIKRDVWMQQFPPPTSGNVLVYDQEGEHAVVMSYDGKQLNFNGEYCDVGNHLVVYLGVMDEATEAYPRTVLSRVDKEDTHPTTCQCRGAGRGCLRQRPESGE